MGTQGYYLSLIDSVTFGFYTLHGKFRMQLSWCFKVDVEFTQKKVQPVRRYTTQLQLLMFFHYLIAELDGVSKQLRPGQSTVNLWNI